MKMAVFWVVAPCRLASVYRCVRGLYCLHHQGDKSHYNPEDSHLQEISIYFLEEVNENVSSLHVVKRIRNIKQQSFILSKFVSNLNLFRKLNLISEDWNTDKVKYKYKRESIPKYQQQNK
jgi:hypothetical protein